MPRHVVAQQAQQEEEEQQARREGGAGGLSCGGIAGSRGGWGVDGCEGWAVGIERCVG
jgi:hypothetical protein